MTPIPTESHPPAHSLSPCINICRMDEVTALCRGCFRTLEEISCWSRAAEAEKQTILTAVNRRRTELSGAANQ